MDRGSQHNDDAWRDLFAKESTFGDRFSKINFPTLFSFPPDLQDEENPDVVGTCPSLVF